MRTRILPLALVVVTGLMAPAHLLGQKKQVESHLSTRQLMDSEMMNLQRNLDRAKSLADRTRVLEKTEKSLRGLRGKGPRQVEKDEIYFDKLLAVLAELPRGTQFDKVKCPAYKTDLMANFDPHSNDEQVTDPALKSGLEVLASFCGKTN